MNNPNSKTTLPRAEGFGASTLDEVIRSENKNRKVESRQRVNQ
jgi:hypothetical protein